MDFNDPPPVRNNGPNRNRKMKGGGPGNNRQQQHPNRGNRGNRKMNGMNNGFNNQRGPPGPLPPPLMMPNMRNMPLRNRPPMGPVPPMPLMGPGGRGPPMPHPMGMGPGPMGGHPMGPGPIGPGPMNGRLPFRGRMPPIPPMMNMNPMRPMPPPLRSQFRNQKFNQQNKPIKKNLTKIDKNNKQQGPGPKNNQMRKNNRNFKKGDNRKNKSRNQKKQQPAYPLDAPFVTVEIKAEHDKKEEILQRLKGKKDDQLFAEFKQQRDLFVKMYDEAKKVYEEANKEKVGISFLIIENRSQIRRRNLDRSLGRMVYSRGRPYIT